VTVLLACAAGYPLARWTDRTADLPRRLGEAYLLGLGVLAVVMFVTTGHWSRVVVLVGTALMVLSSIVVHRLVVGGWRLAG
jgi:hypothetical protein